VRAGGTPAPSYVIANGALPTGLSLASGSGTISGIPGAVGVFSGVISAANGVDPPATQTFSIAIDQASQSITFAGLSTTPVAAPPFAVSATASSGLVVTFSSLTPATCALSSNTVTLVSGGTCTIRASQPGNATWARAPDVDQSFSIVGPSAQTISFAALADRPFGSPPFSVSASASSGLTVSFASLTSATCKVNGATVTAIAVGTCTIRASQSGNLAYAPAANVDQTFMVTSGGQTISFFPLVNRLLDVAPFELRATASSGLPVSFASVTPAICRVNDGWVMLLLAGTCTIRASQEGNGSYAPAPEVAQSFAAMPANQWVLFPQPGPQSLARPQLLASATASSGLPVTYSSLTPAVCGVSGDVVTLVAVGTCTISAVQAGDANHQPASQNRSFSITSATVDLPSAGPIPGPFIEYSTLLGGYRADGFAADTVFDVAVGPDGSAWVGGSVAGTYFPGLSSATFSNGGLDLLYLAKLNPNRGQVDVATIVGARSSNMTGNGTSVLASVEAMAIDASGNVYVAAYGVDRTFPVTGGVYTRTGPKAIFRVAADASVQPLAGSIDPAVQTIRAIAIDSAGGVYFTGVAAGGLRTTINAAIPASTAPAGGPYLIKLAPGGASVAYSTYLSVQGSRPSIAPDPQQSPIDNRTTAYALAVDAAGNAYLAGQAQANDFPVTPDAPDTSDHQNRDAFVAKVSPNGSALLWVARLGGPDAERATSIALSPDGSIVVGGKSATLPRDGFRGLAAFQLDFDYDALLVEREHGFVAKLRADGRDWVFVAPIGSQGGNLVYQPFSTVGDPSPTKVAVDSSGAIYVAGNASLDRRLPVAVMDESGNLRAIQSPAHYADGTLSLPYVTDPELYGAGAFLMKLAPNGDRLVHSVIVNEGRATGLAIDDFGAAYVVGTEAGLPQINAAQAAPGSIFVTKIISQPTPVILTTTPNPSASGQGITLAAKLGDARYAGSIEFRSGAQTLATVPLVGGAAAFSTAFAVGIHRLSAVFRGSGPFDGATAPEVVQLVNQPSAGP
jgi:hypothetical protein